MSTDTATRVLGPDTRAPRSLHFESKDFQAAVKYVLPALPLSTLAFLFRIYILMGVSLFLLPFSPILPLGRAF